MSSASKNPFIFGRVVHGRDFADREDETAELVSDIESRQSVILFSPRRYGKTSLIKQALSKLDSRRFLQIYIDLFPVTSKVQFAEAYAGAIAGSTSGKLDEIIDTIKAHIPGFKLTLRPSGLPASVEIELTRTRRDIDKALGSLYDLPQTLAKKKNKQAVVVFDEFQELVNLDGADIEKGLRTKIQHHDLVSYVFTGSRRHLLDKMFLDKSRPLFKIGKQMHLKRIPSNQFAAFINNKFRSTEINIESSMIESLLATTQSHPYYTQQLCHELWNICNVSKQARRSDLDAAVNQVMSNQNYAYTSIWEELSVKQRSMLFALAREEEKGEMVQRRIFSKEFLEEYNLASPSTVQRAVEQLEEKELVERENGGHRVSDIFFSRWLSKQMQF